VKAHGRPAQEWNALGWLDVVLEQLLDEHRNLKDWKKLPAFNAKVSLEYVRQADI
jgi:hypothetical protein